MGPLPYPAQQTKPDAPFLQSCARVGKKRIASWEAASGGAVFDAPRHGYTRALLEATPRPLASLALPEAQSLPEEIFA